MVVRQGDVYILTLNANTGRHPYVVVQNDATNSSRINSVITCLITSNPRQAHIFTNVALRKGEANLLKDCAVNVSQVYTVEKSLLVRKLGTLRPGRVFEILDCLRMLTDP